MDYYPRGTEAAQGEEAEAAGPHKPPLPSIFLTNARSLANKLDELKLQVALNKDIKDSCVMLIMETWLHSSIPDTAIELAGRTAHRHDRTRDSGKSRGGGLCLYINSSWCTNIAERLC